MSSAYEQLRRARAQNMDRRYQSQTQPYTARVDSLVKESGTGIVTGINAVLAEGGATVTVPVQRGTGVRAGSLVTLLGDRNDPTQPLRFGQIDHSDDASAGNADDADLAVPDFATPDSLSVLLAPDRSSLTIYWHAVEGLACSGYQPSLRRYVGGVPGDWTEPVGVVPHLGGVQLSQLGANFQPGEYVDVQLRAFYSWAHTGTGAFSVPSEVRTFTCAIDNISPGDASGLTATTTTPGIIQLTPASVNRNAHFHQWLYEIATNGAGGGLTYHPSADDLVLPIAGGTYYAAVTPISGSGTLGGRFPAAGYIGPIVIVAAAGPPDTVPPPSWAAPTLAKTRYQETTYLTVTLPTAPVYPYPSDYDFTEARILTNGADYQNFRIPSGQPSGGTVAAFGTSVVTLVGWDKSGNSSAASPSASIALGNAGAPTAAPILTTAAFALGAQITWTAVFGAIAYEVWRAPDVSGAPGGFALAMTTDSLAWLDTLAGSTEIQPTRWYKVRAVNLQGNGPWSNNSQRQFNAMDGQNIRLNSITASQLAADVAIFNKIIANTEVTLNGVFNTSGVFNATRLEIRGSVTTDPNQILLYENRDSYVALRSRISGAGMFFYDDFDGTPHVSIERASFDNSTLLHAHNFYAWKQRSYFDTNYSPLLMIGGISDSIGFQRATIGGASRLVQAADFVFFVPGATANGATADGGYFRISGTGGLHWGNDAGAGGIDLSPMFGGAYSSGLDLGGYAFKARDIYAVRPEAPDRGYHFMGNGGKYVGYDGANYVMPGANLVLNGVTISSSATIKDNITAAGLDTKKAGGLRARRFHLRDDPHKSQRLGFIAEEVRAVLPEAVRATDPTPLRDGDAPGSPLGIDLMAICAAQQELIGDLLARVTKLEGTATL